MGLLETVNVSALNCVWVSLRECGGVRFEVLSGKPAYCIQNRAPAPADS